MDAEQRAAVQQPDKMPETGVGVLVDDGVSAEQLAIPRAADLEITYRDRDVIECRKGHE
jgi:hypothetical protein